MVAITKKQFTSGALWKIIEQFSTKGISLVISIVIMRILRPEDYGLIALTAIFTSLSDVLIDGGFSTALIRKEKVDEYDYSCVFSVSSLIALVLYTVLFFTSPLIADYYVAPSLIPVLRVVGLTFFIQAFSSTRNAIVNRNMQFKFLFYCNTTANVISGIIGILLALFGFGVWALVVQRLLQQALVTLLLFLKMRWKIKWRIDFQRMKEIIHFSIGVVGASLLNYLGGSLYSAIIGKRYSVTELGYYDKGSQLPMQMSLYTFGAMSSVLLPTIASCQTDLVRVKKIIRKVTSMTSFLVIPLMTGMAMLAEELIILLFTEKWLLSLTIMQYSCIYYIATPFMLINVQVFFALGHSKLRVKTELIRLGMMILGLVVFSFVFKSSIDELALVSAIISVLAAAVTFVETRKLIDYQFVEFLSDIWKPIVASSVMVIVLFLMDLFILSPFVHVNIISLMIKIMIGIVIYFGFSILTKMESLYEVRKLFKQQILRR